MRARVFKRGLRDVGLAFVLIAAAALAAVALQELNTQVAAGPARAVDGDTLTIGDMRIRLRGIDAPEMDQICWDANGAERWCGQLAADNLSALVGQGVVSCTWADHDRYGRLLGVCHREGVNQRRSLNEAMVDDGWALAYGDYLAAENRARAQARGIWAFTFDRPQDWRRRTAQANGLAEPRMGIAGIVRRARAVAGLGGHNE